MRRGGLAGPPGSRHSAITNASSIEPMTCPERAGAMFGEIINVQLKQYQLRLDVEQRLVEVGDDVLDVFDADRQSYKSFRDADAILNFFRHGGMGHHRWKRNQSFDAAETFRQR